MTETGSVSEKTLLPDDISQKKWELASDKTFKKRLITKGEGWSCPRDGSVCNVRIHPEPDTSAKMLIDRSEKLGMDLNRLLELVIGEHDTELDHMLDKILEHMKPGEISVFQFEINATERTILETTQAASGGISVQIRLELLSFVEVPEIWELNPAQLVDAARHHKEKGVVWFKNGNFVYALRRFAKAIRYLIVIDREMLEKLAKDNSDAAALYDEYRLLMSTVHSNIAAVQLKSQSYNAVIENCTKALKFDPSNAKALYRRGVAYTQSGKPADAKADFLSALKLAPNDATIRKEVRSFGLPV